MFYHFLQVQHNQAYMYVHFGVFNHNLKSQFKSIKISTFIEKVSKGLMVIKGVWFVCACVCLCEEGLAPQNKTNA